MALADVFRLQVQYRVQDRVCSVGLHYEVTSGGDAATNASDLLNAFIGAVGADVMSVFADDVSLEGLYANCVVPDVALPARSNGRSEPGGDSGESAPANLCAVFTLQTTNPAAIRQGRIYLSGLSKTRLVNGVWEASFVAGALQSIAVDLAMDLSEAGKTFKPVWLHKVSGGSPITPVIMSVNSVRVTAIPFTQRRRTTRQFGSF